MFYTCSNGVRVPATVVGFVPDGLVHLEYFRDTVKVVNRQCKVESVSFAIPSADSPPPHFPYLVTHFTDAMPISSIGGALSDLLFNPKYAGYVWKITVTVDHLGNIVWICPVLPGTSADVKIWDTVITGAVRALCENAPLEPYEPFGLTHTHSLSHGCLCPQPPEGFHSYVHWWYGNATHAPPPMSKQQYKSQI